MSEATPENKEAPKPKSEVAAAPPKEKEAPRRRKGRREAPSTGVAHLLCTFNNTIVTITDTQGKVICWSSAGKKGFKGARKSTPFAAQIAAEDAARTAADMGLRTLSVLVNGPGAGRETALRGLQVNGIRISFIRDITPIPHNGCRPSKRRRV